jgi:hypothetical protein
MQLYHVGVFFLLLTALRQTVFEGCQFVLRFVMMKSLTRPGPGARVFLVGRLRLYPAQKGRQTSPAHTLSIA